MRYTTFGRQTGLRVSELALGTGTFGTSWGHGAERDEARRIFDTYVEAGGNFFDCADIYQFGQAETFLGELVASDRDRFVIATKYTYGSGPDSGPSRTGNSRKAMVSSLEGSLRRLKLDAVDVYWVHIPDGATPTEEIARALDDVVRAGKVHYVGLSNFPAWRVSRAHAIAELRGWAPISAIQIEYSLVERTAERELLPMAEALGLAAALWSPLGGGLLTGKYREGETGRLSASAGPVHDESTQQKTRIVDEVRRIAQELGTKPAPVAIAWVRAKVRASTTTLIPLLGANTQAQLVANLAALEVSLSDDHLRRLDEVSAVPLGTPHEMIAGPQTRAGVSGGIPELLDRPRTPVA